MILVGKASAWPSQDGNLDLLERGHHVIPNAPGIGDRTVLAHPNPFINTPAQVLGKVAVDVAADRVFRLVGVDHQLAGGRRAVLSSPCKLRRESAGE